MPVPQISIFLDANGALRAEAPGTNGSRRKIDLPLGFADQNPELVADLRDQEARLRANARREAEDRKTRIAGRIAQTPNQGPKFANKIINDCYVTPTGRVYTNSEWLTRHEALVARTKADETQAPKNGTKPKSKSLKIKLNLTF